MPPRKSTSTGVSRGRPAAKTTKPSQTKLAFHGPVSKKADHAESKKLASKIEAIETPVAPITSIDLPTDNLDSSEQTDLDIFPPGLSTLQFDDDEMIAWKEAVHSARKISPARIKSYWTRKEKDRTVARVHQEGMSLHEKLLADWDIDSRFGVSYTPHHLNLEDKRG